MKSSNGRDLFCIALLMKSFNPLDVSPAGMEVNESSGSPGIAEGSSPASTYFCLELGNAHRFCKRLPVWGVGVVVERFDIKCFASSTSHFFCKILAHAHKRGEVVRSKGLVWSSLSTKQMLVVRTHLCSQ